MNLKILAANFQVIFTMFLLVPNGVAGQGRVIVNIPTVEHETEYIWRKIQDIKFFNQNSYQVNLPAGSLIQELITVSRAGKLADEYYPRLEAFVRDSIYNITDYKKGKKKIENELPLINKMISQINSPPYKWHFKEFETYHINLTLYGPGGSYDPEEGSILIFTTPQGQFKNYDNPACTIIHEITHIGIEEAIVNKYNVPHPLKERIVDSFVSLHFKTYLPDYRIQDMGDKRIDSYLKSRQDLKNLDKFVESAMNNE